jgi:hypothetical protein
MLTRRVVPPQEPPGHHQTLGTHDNPATTRPSVSPATALSALEALTWLEATPSTRQNHRLDKPFHISLAAAGKPASSWQGSAGQESQPFR